MRVVSDAYRSAPRALPLWWVLLALLLMACSQPDGADGAPESAASRAVPVRTVQVAQQDLEVTVGAIGSLTAAEEITIRPEIAGVVDAIHFREGKPVARDARLFSLESDKIRQSLAARRAALKAAEAETVNTRTILRRRRLLLAQKVIPRETFDEAQTAYKTTAAHQERLEAEIRRIQAQLDDTMIRSPIDGMATALGVEVGDFVESGQALVTIVQSDVLEIDFTVPERYVNQVAEGQAVTVRTAAAEGRTFAGHVFFISPAIRENTRDLHLKARIQNPRGQLHPGAFATVTLTLNVREKALVIPEEALVPLRTGYSVFVIEEDRARRREVTIGERRPGRVEIRRGLQAGQTVIRSGHISVADGDRVTILDDP